MSAAESVPAGSDKVTLVLSDGIATVSFNRPDRHNAIDDEAAERLGELFRHLHTRSDVRAVVLRGEGPSFSSGRDLKELGRRAGGETHLEFVGLAQDRIRLISTMPVPVIAALKGWVLGGSFERSLHCDIRIAATDTRMALPEVAHGVIPDTGGVVRLLALAGPGLVKDMVLTGRVLTAEEALAAGIVSRVVSPEDLDEAAQTLARAIADAPPLTVRLARQVIDDLYVDQNARSMRQELLAQNACFESEDYREARSSRQQGRTPRFQGR